MEILRISTEDHDTNETELTCEDDALGKTLDYVRRNIPFYSRNGGCRRYHTLGDFPVIDAGILARHMHSLYYLDTFPDFIATSGGTTGQARKLLIRNYAELDAASRECKGVAVADVLSGSEIRSFTLNLTDFQHGLTLPPRHGLPIVSVPLESGCQLPVVEALMREGLMLRERRIGASRIIGSATKLRALTAYCAATDAGFNFHIHEVVSTSFYCSQIWRRIICDYWGASLHSAYWLSEFPKITTIACLECGLYHLPRTVHVEVLAPESDVRAVDGPGRLVLTSLLPFRRAMPLIRYDTRDIVRLRPTPDCSRAATGLEFLGREAQVLLDRERKRALLTPFEIVHAVEAILGADLVRGTEVETAMRVGIGEVEPDFSEVGYPSLRVEKGGGDGLAGGYCVIAECRAPRPELENRLRDALSERV